MNALARFTIAALFAAPAVGGNLTAQDIDLEHMDLRFLSTSALIRPAVDPLKLPVIEYTGSGDDRFQQPPRALDDFEPVYPYALLREGVRGFACVAVIFDAKGVVVRTCVREATRPEFGQSLIAALIATRFEPAIVGRDPAPVIIGLRHDFVPSGFGSSVSRDERRALELELKNPQSIAKATSLDTPLRLTKRVNPVFPRLGDGALQAGDATVEFLVDEDGHAHLPRVASATEPEFGFAAVQAVAGWRFERPQAAGRPAVVRVRVALKFNLANDGTPVAQTP